MTDQTRLVLLTPVLDDPAAFAARLGEACAGGSVAAVIARLGSLDERSLVNGVKALAAAAQEHGAAVLVSLAPSAGLDPVLVAARGGADGVHLPFEPRVLADARDRLRDGRMLGCGGLRTRDDAMVAGEAGVDYLLFGEPRPDGSLPALDGVIERAAWWAEIFETPCIAFCPTLGDLAAVAATGAEFVGLGDAIFDHPEGPRAAVARAVAILSEKVP